ncbi:Mss4-like protein [Gymnopilus junonius]|uniref:Mss4-like protein n=1 Tax=Gymnopilus junonius TaxID=109634 RepID=A0A9P5TM31_GYMJU|nr:Mss4-like protein [Gymnopilus junonius]
MPVELKGSCHCGAVRFTLQSSTPVPYQLCLRSGWFINLGGHSKTLKIEGKENISVYKARIASSERNFCKKCSAMLWLYDETWPELIHPFASAIDSPELESPKTMVCVKLNSKPSYVRLPEGRKQTYEDYGELSLEEWHKKHKLFKE